jgi:hypothetical protein
MPKPYTIPLLIDQEKTLKTAFLSKYGYFKTDCKITGVTGWTSNKSKDLDIYFTTIMQQGKERVILNFHDFNSKPVEQIIFLEPKPSNLGKGLIWYFICPYTGATCRNLIFVNNRFMHRSNMANATYSTQVESKYWRKMFQLMPNIPTTQRILNEPNKKYYKKFYKGQITKRYKKWFATVQKWNDNSNERKDLINKFL